MTDYFKEFEFNGTVDLNLSCIDFASALSPLTQDETNSINQSVVHANESRPNEPKVQGLQVFKCFKSFTHLRDSAIEAIALFHPTLTYIDISESSRISDNSILAIAMSCKGTGLKYIGLNGCIGVTDIGIMKLFENCCSLENVDIGSCSISI